MYVENFVKECNKSHGSWSGVKIVLFWIQRKNWMDKRKKFKMNILIRKIDTSISILVNFW